MVADDDSFAVAGAAEVGGVSYVGYAVYGFVGGLEAAVFDVSAGQQGGYFAGSGGAELAGGVDDAGNCGGVGSASDAVDYYCAYGKLAFVAFASGFALDQGCEELGIADACRDYACIFFLVSPAGVSAFVRPPLAVSAEAVIAFVCAASLAAISWRVSPLSTSKSTEMKSEEI